MCVRVFHGPIYTNVGELNIVVSILGVMGGASENHVAFGHVSF